MISSRQHSMGLTLPAGLPRFGLGVPGRARPFYSINPEQGCCNLAAQASGGSYGDYCQCEKGSVEAGRCHINQDGDATLARLFIWPQFGLQPKTTTNNKSQPEGK